MSQASGCGGCGSGFNLLKSSSYKDKLGKCPFCIAASLIGMIFGWAFFISFSLSNIVIINNWILLYVSLFFTILFLAHMIAYYIRNKKQ